MYSLLEVRHVNVSKIEKAKRSAIQLPCFTDMGGCYKTSNFLGRPIALYTVE